MIPVTYEIATDNHRPVTQRDIDGMHRVIQIQGRMIAAFRKAFEEYEAAKIGGALGPRLAGRWDD
jgi:hypothetical protein